MMRGSNGGGVGEVVFERWCWRGGAKKQSGKRESLNFGKDGNRGANLFSKAASILLSYPDVLIKRANQALTGGYLSESCS